MPLLTVEHVLTTEDRLLKAEEGSYEEAVKNAYWDTFVCDRPGEGAKMRHEFLLETAGIKKLVAGKMEYSSLETKAMEIEHADFGDGLKISRNQFLDDQFAFAGDWAAQMGARAALHPQDLGIEVLKTNPIGYDGVAFFSASHPLFDAAGSTYTNVRTTSALTLANFVLACAQMESFRSPGGTSRGIKPKYLIVPPALRKEAYEITGAKQISATDNVVSNYGVTPVVAADLAGSTPGGSDTTWYLTSTKPGTHTHPVIYSRREDFIMTSYEGVSQVELGRTNLLEWQFRGRAAAAPGLPYLAIRCTA